MKHTLHNDGLAAAGSSLGPAWRNRIHPLLTLILALLFTGTARAERPLIPSINLGGNTYSNVVVREVSDRTVTIAHSRGMASINQSKLTTRELEDLGLIEKAPPPPPKPQRKIFAPPAEGELQTPPAEVPSLDEIVKLAGQFTSMDSEGVQRLVAAVPSIPGRSFLIAAGAYFFLCLCFLLICNKAGKPAPLMVWVPILQMFPLYRAAGMSPVWFGLTLFNLVMQLGLVAMIVMQMASAHMVLGCLALFLLLNLVHVVGSIIWCFKICVARGKSAALGILFLFPGLNLLALLYLAFSAGPEIRPTLIPVRQPISMRERERSMAD